ncbi:Uncharacterized protein APZ42_015033 [Daphnia magna]|uniref:Uncharacterized protein n=1 Tax=Daphnia magna TaxID=35525 RepID=A0A162P3W2_9CRUS|nr:Uncharacterized protein APZ42_015033 [Daphnia magna]
MSPSSSSKHSRNIIDSKGSAQLFEAWAHLLSYYYLRANRKEFPDS